MQTRSVTGGDFSCKRQLETPLRCKLQEKIASCDMAFSSKSNSSCSKTFALRVAEKVETCLLLSTYFFKVFRSIGYRSVPFDDDIPFDHQRGVVSCSSNDGHVTGQPGNYYHRSNEICKSPWKISKFLEICSKFVR